jgi:hypothetical protein
MASKNNKRLLHFIKEIIKIQGYTLAKIHYKVNQIIIIFKSNVIMKL